MESIKKFLSNKRNRTIAILAAVLVVALIILAVVIAVKSRGSRIDSEVTSAQATIGDVSTTIQGTGNLESAKSTHVKVPDGVKIDEVKVSTGEKVYKGETIATVTESSVATALLEVREKMDALDDLYADLDEDALDDEDSDEYLQALVMDAQLDELLDAEEALEEMLEDEEPQIRATVSGTISSMDVSDGTEVGGSSSSSEAEALENGTSEGISASEKDQESGLTFLTVEKTLPYTADLIWPSEGAGADLSLMSDEDSYIFTSKCYIPVTAPSAGAKPQTSISKDTFASYNNGKQIKRGSISWSPSASTFKSGTTYTATITLQAADNYMFDSSVVPIVNGATVTTYKVMSDGKILYVKARFDGGSSSSSSNGGTQDGDTGGMAGREGSDGGDGSDGFYDDEGHWVFYDEDGELVYYNEDGELVYYEEGDGLSSGQVEGNSDNLSNEEEATVDLTQYGLAETSVCSISSGSSVVVNISVDELDILSVEEGQTAVITLDALEGEEFEGEISKVSASASASNGGSVKYAVEISLERMSNMMLGMSASATIYVQEARDTIVIPVSALQESGDTTFVYTELDRKGNMSGEVEVTTGYSDGSLVQITSGLVEGETVYYLKSESTDTTGFGFGMMGGGMMGGGAQPEGDGNPGERGDRGGERPGGNL